MIRSKLAHWRHLTKFYRQSGFAPSLQTLLQGVTAAIMGTSLSMILSAVTQTLIVRALSVLLYGEYATIAASLGLMSIALGIGLDTWILHDVSRNPDRLTATIRDVLVLKSIGAALLLVLVMLAWSARVVNASAFLIGAMGIVFEAFAMTGYSALRALKRNGIVALFQTLGAILQLALVWLFWRGSILDVTFVFGLQTSSSIFTALAIFWYLWRLAGMRLPKGLQVRRVIQGSWLLVTSDVLATIYGQVVVVTLGTLASAEAAGIFRPALNIIIYAFVIPGLIAAVGLPILNGARYSMQEFRLTAALMVCMAILYGLSVMIGLRVWGGAVIDLIYGSAYSRTLPIINAIDIVVLLKSINMVCVSLLIARDRMQWRVIVQMPIALYSVLGSFLLIPAYEVQGAVIITVTTEILLFIGYGIGAWRTLRHPHS